MPLRFQRLNLSLQLRDLFGQCLDFGNRMMQRQGRIHLDDVIIKSQGVVFITTISILVELRRSRNELHILTINITLRVLSNDPPACPFKVIPVIHERAGFQLPDVLVRCLAVVIGDIVLQSGIRGS